MTMAIGSVAVAWHQGTSWASVFEIQVSLDDTTWTPVFTGRSSGQTLQLERYDFPTVTGRYVRIVGHGQWSGTTLLSLWNSIAEVAIYASAAVGSGPPTPDPKPVASVAVGPAAASPPGRATVEPARPTQDPARNPPTRPTGTWPTDTSH